MQKRSWILAYLLQRNQISQSQMLHSCRWYGYSKINSSFFSLFKKLYLQDALFITYHSLYLFMLSLIYSIRAESYTDFRTHCVIMTVADGELLFMVFWKLIEFDISWVTTYFPFIFTKPAKNLEISLKLWASVKVAPSWIFLKHVRTE